MEDAILRQRENAQRFKVRALFMVFSTLVLTSLSGAERSSKVANTNPSDLEWTECLVRP